MLWISKEKFAEFERKVNALDPENVSARLKKAVEEIEKFQKETREELEKVVETQATNISAELRKAFEQAVKENIESLSGSLEKIIQKKGEEQDKKINDFISLSKRNAVRALTGSFELIRRTLGITEKELDEITKEEKKVTREEDVKEG